MIIKTKYAEIICPYNVNVIKIPNIFYYNPYMDGLGKNIYYGKKYYNFIDTNTKIILLLIINN